MNLSGISARLQGMLAGVVRPNWRPYVPEPISWRGIAWSIIPGLGHLQVGQRRLGWGLLGAWSTGGLIFLATFPSNATPWFVMLLVLIHSITITTFLRLNLNYETMFARVLFGALLFVTMNSLVYGSVGWLVRRMWAPMVVPSIIDNALLESGDGLIYEGAWHKPEKYDRGDLVVYDFNSQSGLGYMVAQGISIDRVVGVPGDRVEIRGRNLLINGRRPEEGKAPLADMPPLAALDIELGSNQYAIIPSLVRFTLVNMREFPDTRGIVIVPIDGINGRVLYRSQPWSRRGALR